MFAALGNRNYRLFWGGQSVSLVGTWAQNAAVWWLVPTRTNSPLALGLVSRLDTDWESDRGRDGQGETGPAFPSLAPSVHDSRVVDDLEPPGEVRSPNHVDDAIQTARAAVRLTSNR